MDFGIQFFPTSGPAQQTGAEFWANALRCVDLCDELGYTSVRTVEHYFGRYGGYSPSPVAFLSAAAMRTQKARLVTGAVLPAFSHPLKLASELMFLDAISNGRLEAGFARAFLPIEFERFGVSLDESRARFEEAMTIIGRVMTQERVSYDGTFWRFPETTIMPRPTQQPRPPFWIAAVQTESSFEAAGRNGYGVMAIPVAGAVLRKLLGVYRDAWKKAGHPGNGRVMIAFHMYCAPSMDEATATAGPEIDAYLKTFADAARAWTTGTSSKDYPGYDKIVEHLDKATWQSQVENCSAWIGTPKSIASQIAEYSSACGGFDIASLQVNYGAMNQEKARASMRLFAQEVIPQFKN